MTIESFVQTDAVVTRAREVLELDRNGLPHCPDTAAMWSAVEDLRRIVSAEAYFDIVIEQFLRGASERRASLSDELVEMPTGSFLMGTAHENTRHFCGETPAHLVTVSAFAIGRVTVTNKRFALLDPRRLELPRSQWHLPVVDVNWFDAALFALWMGCRLPTEAEWEYAAGAGSPEDWSCAEAALPEYAWFSENADDQLHPVATRLSNTRGIHDLYGNVWEWCADDYGADFYSFSPHRDPVHIAATQRGLGNPATNVHKVARGGSIWSLAEMCRTQFRLHDPADYRASDLGIRLATDREGDPMTRGHEQAETTAQNYPMTVEREVMLDGRNIIYFQARG